MGSRRYVEMLTRLSRRTRHARRTSAGARHDAGAIRCAVRYLGAGDVRIATARSVDAVAMESTQPTGPYVSAVRAGTALLRTGKSDSARALLEQAEGTLSRRRQRDGAGVVSRAARPRSRRPARGASRRCSVVTMRSETADRRQCGRGRPATERFGDSTRCARSHSSASNG